MTSVCTMLGLVPMSLGIGEGSELQVPLARVVIGGLLTSTLITLVFVPAMYTLFEEGWRGLFKQGAAGALSHGGDGQLHATATPSARGLTSSSLQQRPAPSGPSPDRIQSPAISASGSSTKSRSRNRGCGTRSPGSSDHVSPYRIRSRSSVRGAPACGRALAPLALDATAALEQIARRRVSWRRSPRR